MTRVAAFALVAAFLFGSEASFGATDFLTKLSEGDKLSEIVEEQATTWTDGNISTGTSTVVAGTTATVPKTEDTWKKFATDLFADRFKRYVGEDLPAEAKLRVSANAFERKKHIQAAVDALVEANAYNDENQEIQDSLTEEVSKLVDALGASSDLYFTAIKTRLLDDGSGEKRNIRIHAFTNITNGKTIVIFTIEGTM